MNQFQLFSVNSTAHMLKIIKRYVSKKWHFFPALDEPANSEVNFDVISNVMTFLTLRVKCFKRPYFHE